MAALVLAGAGVVTAAASSSAAPETAARAATACPTGWGSGTKGSAPIGSEPLTDIRTGRHDCFDRMVFDVPGGGSGLTYYVGYVDRFYADPSGQYIPVAGGAILQVVVGAPSYDPDTYTPVYPGRVGRQLPGVNVSGYSTFRDTRFGGSFEGQTQIGLGVRARLPFRVLQLSDRLVVDVAHNWTGTPAR
jgi:hypothetical protein